MAVWHFPMDVLVKNIFCTNSDKSLWCLYEQNIHEYLKYRLEINTEFAYMPIDEKRIVRLFLSSV